MSTRLQVLALLAIVCVVTLAAAPPATQNSGEVVFEDHFDGQLKSDWSWVREDKASWRIENGALHLTVLPGSLWEQNNAAKNVLLIAAPPGDISAEVTATSEPKDTAEQATLLWYVGDDEYVKLCKEFMGGKQNVVLAREHEGKGKAIVFVPTDGKTIRLKLTRHGDKLTGEFANGADAPWTTAGTCDVPSGAEVKIGLVTHGAQTGAKREAEFKDFRITKPAK